MTIIRRIFNTAYLARHMWRGWPDPWRWWRDSADWPPPAAVYDPRADYDLWPAIVTAWAIAEGLP